jgi:hypothetical protein
MEISKHHIDGRTGIIIKIDEPGDLDTMYRTIHEQQRLKIKDIQRDKVFVLIVFGKKPKKKSEQCLSRPDLKDGWYPVNNRIDMNIASDWHAHNGVVIHCPYQEEVVIPTGVSTENLVHEGRKSTGIYPISGALPDRERQLVLNEAVTKFTPDIVQPSGYSLIIPARETHVKMTAPENHNGTGGFVQRRTWSD